MIRHYSTKLSNNIKKILLNTITYTHYPKLENCKKAVYDYHNEELNEQKKITDLVLFDKNKKNMDEFLTFRKEEDIIIKNHKNHTSSINCELYSFKYAKKQPVETLQFNFSNDIRKRTFTQTETIMMITSYGKIGQLSIVHVCTDKDAAFEIVKFERIRDTKYEFLCINNCNLLLDVKFQNILCHMDLSDVVKMSNIINILKDLMINYKDIPYRTKCEYCCTLIRNLKNTDKEIVNNIFDLCFYNILKN